MLIFGIILYFVGMTGLAILTGRAIHAADVAAGTDYEDRDYHNL